MLWLGETFWQKRETADGRVVTNCRLGELWTPDLQQNVGLENFGLLGGFVILPKSLSWGTRARVLFSRF